MRNISRSAVSLLSVASIFLAVPSFCAEGPLASSVQPFVEQHTLAGAVMLVASRDRTVDVETVGFADLARRAAMRPDALFWVASESKPITATALMMLVEEGKVDLNDPVEKYLPEFKGQMVVVEHDSQHVFLRKPGHPILVREILSHTSGLPATSALEKPTLDILPLQYRVRSYAMTPLDFEPGLKYQYSNAGINTAGRIIEVISGIPCEKFLDERLFKPLGMKDTTFWPSKSQLKRLALAYKPNATKDGLTESANYQLQSPLDDRARQPMPAGGLFSTAQDMARFGRMFLNGGIFEGRRYLSEASVKQMTSRQTPPEIKDSYGFGWSVNGEMFFHGGAFATKLEIDPPRGLVLVWMVQHNGFPGNGNDAFGVFKKAAEEKFGAHP